jgi:hypothetical protein
VSHFSEQSSAKKGVFAKSCTQFDALSEAQGETNLVPLLS